jgi:hypothetical protein
MGRLTEDNDTLAALQLVLQISMLAENLADLREAQGRLHQAHIAHNAAHRLREIAAIRPATTGPTTQKAALGTPPRTSTTRATP